MGTVVERYGGFSRHVLSDMAHDERFLSGVDSARFLDRFTHHFAEVNALHPLAVDFGLLDPSAYNRVVPPEHGWLDRPVARVVRHGATPRCVVVVHLEEEAGHRPNGREDWAVRARRPM